LKKFICKTASGHREKKKSFPEEALDAEKKLYQVKGGV